MTTKEKAAKVVAELEAAQESNLYDELPISDSDKKSAYMGRIGALQLATLLIKSAFGLPGK